MHGPSSPTTATDNVVVTRKTYWALFVWGVVLPIALMTLVMLMIMSFRPINPASDFPDNRKGEL